MAAIRPVAWESTSKSVSVNSIFFGISLSSSSRGLLQLSGDPPLIPIFSFPRKVFDINHIQLENTIGDFRVKVRPLPTAPNDGCLRVFFPCVNCRVLG